MSRDIRAEFDAETRKAMALWCVSEMRWGTDDCGLSIAAIDQVVLGIDSGAIIRGRYRTSRGAARAMGKGGLVRTLAKIARKHGWTRIKPKDGRTGDRGLVMTPAGAAMVIKYGEHWVGRRDYGFAALTDADVRIAYGVTG